MLALVAIVCTVAVVGIANCAGAFSNDSEEIVRVSIEENEAVTTDLAHLDSDGDRMPDLSYDVSELDANAEPSGSGWSEGDASAYGLDDNDGYDETASGVPLDEVSFTVAVPLSQADLLGSTVELFYGGIYVSAMVTDLGGFEDYGRALDLAPAVWRAFGADSEDDWGVRTISYRFVEERQENAQEG